MTRFLTSAEGRFGQSAEKRFLRGLVCEELIVERVRHRFSVPPACSAASGHWEVLLRWTGTQRRPYDDPPFAIPLHGNDSGNQYDLQIVGGVCPVGPTPHDYYQTDGEWFDFGNTWSIEIGFGGTNGTDPAQLVVLFPDEFGVADPPFIEGECVSVVPDRPPSSNTLWIEDITWGVDLPPCDVEGAHGAKWWRYQLRWFDERAPGPKRERLGTGGFGLSFDYQFAPCAQPDPAIQVHTSYTHWDDPPFGGPSNQYEFPTADAGADLRRVVVWVPDNTGIYDLPGWALWDWFSTNDTRFELFSYTGIVSDDPRTWGPPCPPGEHWFQQFTGPAHSFGGRDWRLLGNTSRAIYFMNPSSQCGIGTPYVNLYHDGYLNNQFAPNGDVEIYFPVEVNPISPYPFQAGEQVTVIDDVNWDPRRF